MIFHVLFTVLLFLFSFVGMEFSREDEIKIK